MHSSHPILMLLLQAGLIIALSRLMGLVFARLRQPQVIGEILAGIMLGPTLLGAVSPGAFATLFPAESLPALNILSQLGVIFFLFLVGLEFDPAALRSKGRSAVLISISSIAVPFLLGIGLTFFLYERIFHGVANSNFQASALFMGTAVSVTAFPVLARILSERSLHKTRVGTISLTAAAVNDVIAWCALAFVVAVARYEGPGDAARTAGLAVLYVLFMLFVVKPLLGRLQAIYERQERLNGNVVAVIFLLLCASAWASEWIGIHALFGAFLLGAIMPKHMRFIRHLTDKFEDFTIVFLLPLFFAYTGLQADLRDVFRADTIGYTALVVTIACCGKIFGAAGAARLTGSDWRESSAVGVLMNTRGLMELVILKIGLDLGVINDTVFAMMVIMALVTTAMTVPLLHWVYPRRLLIQREAEARKVLAPGAPAILIPVSLPRSGPPLVFMADLLSGGAAAGRHRRITALYLRRPIAQEAYDSARDAEIDPADHPALQPLMQEAHRLGMEVEARSQVSREVPSDIATIAEASASNLILMGFHKPVLGTTLLGGTVHRVLTRAAETDVAILFDRGLRQVKSVLVPYMGSRHDRFALELARRIARTSNAAVTVLHIAAPHRADEPEPDLQQAVERLFHPLRHNSQVTFRTVESDQPIDLVLDEARRHDLVIIGVANEWGLASQLFGWRSERIARDCPTSLLIVRKAEKPTAVSSPAPAPSGPLAADLPPGAQR